MLCESLKSKMPEPARSLLARCHLNASLSFTIINMCTHHLMLILKLNTPLVVLMTRYLTVRLHRPYIAHRRAPIRLLHGARL